MLITWHERGTPDNKCSLQASEIKMTFERRICSFIITGFFVCFITTMSSVVWTETHPQMHQISPQNSQLTLFLIMHIFNQELKEPGCEQR